MDVMEQLEEHGREYARHRMARDLEAAARERKKAERVLTAYFDRMDRILHNRAPR